MQYLWGCGSRGCISLVPCARGSVIFVGFSASFCIGQIRVKGKEFFFFPVFCAPNVKKYTVCILAYPVMPTSYCDILAPVRCVRYVCPQRRNGPLKYTLFLPDGAESGSAYKLDDFRSGIFFHISWHALRGSGSL